MDSATEKHSSVATSNAEKSIQESSQRCTLSDRAARRLEVTILTLAIVCVVGLLSLPSVLYLARKVNISPTNTKNDTGAFLNFSGCGEYGLPNSSACSSLIWGSNSSSCNPEPYTGSVCSTHLLNWQDCAVGPTEIGIIAISTSSNQAETEQLATEIVDFIDEMASTECRQDAISFLCLYKFPICSCLEQQLFLPTKEECERISTTTCQLEFNFALKSGLGDLLPDCDQLPSTSTNSAAGSGLVDDGLFLNKSNITCSPDFYLENSICFPLCREWKQYSDAESILVTSSVATGSLLGILGSVAVIIGSIIRYKSMLVFPSVFILYLIISLLFIAFSFLLAISNSTLFCNSEDLIESISNPTTFCTISGVIFQYCIVSTTVWWLFHVASTFYKVMFPMTVQRWKKKEKYIHLSLLILGLLFPFPSVIVTLTQENHGYVIVNFPSLFCGPSNSDLLFYSIILINNIILVTGIPLLIIVAWTLHKNQLALSYRKRMWKISTAETKILLVLSYYALFGLVSLSYFSVASADQDVFIVAVEQNFLCEAAGSGMECDRSDFEQFTYPGFVSVVIILLGLVPTVNLIFVVNWTGAKESCQQIWMRCSQRIFSKRTIPSNINYTMTTFATE